MIRSLAALALLILLTGCGGRWSVDYEAPVAPEVARGWQVVNIEVTAPPTLTTTENNVMAPRADVVWHGEGFGDRRAQAAAIVEAGIAQAASRLQGPRPVIFAATIERFHAVTPRAVAAAPAAVHDIVFGVRVFDAETGAPLTPPARIEADIEANVGAAAIVAAQEGRTQKVRITDHIGRVTAAWLGIGPDVRRKFVSLGR